MPRYQRGSQPKAGAVLRPGARAVLRQHLTGSRIFRDPGGSVHDRAGRRADARARPIRTRARADQLVAAQHSEEKPPQGHFSIVFLANVAISIASNSGPITVSIAVSKAANPYGVMLPGQLVVNDLPL